MLDSRPDQEYFSIILTLLERRTFNKAFRSDEQIVFPDLSLMIPRKLARRMLSNRGIAIVTPLASARHMETVAKVTT